MCDRCYEFEDRALVAELLLERLRAEMDASEIFIPEELHLKPTQAAILRFLIKHDKVLSKPMLFTLTRYPGAGLEVWDEPSGNLISVHICGLRRRLRPFGLEITTVVGEGYRLPERTRQRLLNWTQPTQNAA